MVSDTKAPQSIGVRTGKIIALCYSPELINGVGKEPHTSAEITRFGITGDHHYGETRTNSKGQVVPNNRPITVVGVEGAREACRTLGVPEIPIGGLGENFLLEGLGDLNDVGPGDEIHVLSETGEPQVVLSVWMQNDPCSNLMVYHKQMPKQMYGKRGLLCTVLKEGTANVDDTVQIVSKGTES